MYMSHLIILHRFNPINLSATATVGLTQPGTSTLQANDFDFYYKQFICLFNLTYNTEEYLIINIYSKTCASATLSVQLILCHL